MTLLASEAMKKARERSRRAPLVETTKLNVGDAPRESPHQFAVRKARELNRGQGAGLRSNSGRSDGGRAPSLVNQAMEQAKLLNLPGRQINREDSGDISVDESDSQGETLGSSTGSSESNQCQGPSGEVVDLVDADDDVRKTAASSLASTTLVRVANLAKVLFAITLTFLLLTIAYPLEGETGLLHNMLPNRESIGAVVGYRKGDLVPVGSNRDASLTLVERFTEYVSHRDLVNMLISLVVGALIGSKLKFI